MLHRWADKDGQKLCAMSALSKKLGYTPLTDTPKEVDSGLATLVNLLNDRANDRARQLLIWRLEYVPNTGRAKIRELMSHAFFPTILENQEFDEEAKFLWGCKGIRETARVYSSLGERLLRPDGAGFLANGCITLAAALKSRDPVTRQ